MIAVVLFELIVFFHEFGHFITAKKCGVKVNEFALGMGPKLFSFTKGETTYSLRLLPIGGFCAMEGEDEESDSPRSFNNASVLKRMIIVIAGVVMNILFGLVLMMICLLSQDCFASTTVSGFDPLSYSAVTGLEVGDKITEINGYKTYTANDFSFALYTLDVTDTDGASLQIYKEDCIYNLNYEYATLANDYKDDNKILTSLSDICVEGANKLAKAKDKDEAYKLMCSYIDKLYEVIDKKDEVEYPTIKTEKTRKRFRTSMTVIRNGEEVKLDNIDFFTYQNDKKEPALAIDFHVEPIEKTFTTVITQTFSQTLSVVRMVWASVIGLVTGQFGINEVSGPVGLVSAVSDVASQGLKESFSSAVMNIVYVMMVITVNLGVANILPIPVLDGGKFVLLIIEGITKRPIPKKVEGILNAIGIVFLILLMVVVTFKDVWMLIFGG